MGKLRVTSDGIRVEGVAEFLEPLITTNITSDEVQNCKFHLYDWPNVCTMHSELNYMSLTPDLIKYLCFFIAEFPSCATIPSEY